MLHTGGGANLFFTTGGITIGLPEQLQIMKPGMNVLILAVFLAALPATAQVPGIISHQGKVTVGGTNYTGTGLFRFALVNAAGTTTYWSNDGTSSGEPTAAVSLTVTRSVFSVNLGDIALTHMTTIPASVFSTDPVYLRVWFNGGNGSQLLSPDRRITSVAYALKASVADTYTETDPVYVAAQAGFLKTDGSRDLTGDLKLGGNHLLNLPGTASITADNEAASKAYVDSKVSGLTWQPSVTDILNTPPGSPATGDRYIVGTSPAGQWATDSAANNIAQWTGSAWSYTPPSTSMAAFVTAKSNGYVYSGAWVQFSGSTYTFGAGLSYSAPNVSVASGGITAAMLNQMSAASGQVLGWNGSAWVPTTAAAGTVTSVTATGPLTSSGGTTPDLSLPPATSGANGYLSSADWTTFNSKESVLTFSSPLSRSVNSISLPVATTSASGYLSGTDWTTFNGKVAGTRNIATTAPLSGGGTLASDLTLSIPVATTSANGYLSSANWTTFNSKIGGSGTAIYVPKFTASGTVGDSSIVSDASGNVGIGTASPSTKLEVAGTVKATAFSGDGAALVNIPAAAVVAAPPGMALISAGSFTMGNSIGDSDITATPMTITVSAFYMDVNLVTSNQWRTIYNWATLVGGYTFVNAGAGKAGDHPVQGVDWYDTVKWCNARSEQAGKTPVYYTEAGFTTVYRTGEVTVYANWAATGYRLPTEAEFEKAARGGLSGKRFPWGDTISQKLANYFGATSTYTYDLGPNGYNAVGTNGGSSPATSPVGSFAANGYGLSDMDGNVYQWCWDWYGTPLGQPTTNNPTGPAGPSSDRVLRGGAWYYYASSARCAYRGNITPSFANSVIGFRCVRGF